MAQHSLGYIRTWLRPFTYFTAPGPPLTAEYKARPDQITLVFDYNDPRQVSQRDPRHRNTSLRLSPIHRTNCLPVAVRVCHPEQPHLSSFRLCSRLLEPSPDSQRRSCFPWADIGNHLHATNDYVYAHRMCSPYRLGKDVLVQARNQHNAFDGRSPASPDRTLSA